MEERTFGFIEGFAIMNKVCNLLEENGCPKELSSTLGAEIFFTVTEELGFKSPKDAPKDFEDAFEMVYNAITNESEE